MVEKLNKSFVFGWGIRKDLVRSSRRTNKIWFWSNNNVNNGAFDCNSLWKMRKIPYFPCLMVLNCIVLLESTFHDRNYFNLPPPKKGPLQKNSKMTSFLFFCFSWKQFSSIAVPHNINFLLQMNLVSGQSKYMVMCWYREHDFPSGH